jgi:hypothetical protein
MWALWIGVGDAKEESLFDDRVETVLSRFRGSVTRVNLVLIVHVKYDECRAHNPTDVTWYFACIKMLKDVEGWLGSHV